MSQVANEVVYTKAVALLGTLELTKVNRAKPSFNLYIYKDGSPAYHGTYFTLPKAMAEIDRLIAIYAF